MVGSTLDREMVNFMLYDHELTLRPEVYLSYPFGIASWRTTAALRNIQIRRLLPEPQE